MTGTSEVADAGGGGDAEIESLRRSEELYRTLVESSKGLVWRRGEGGRYTFLNRAWEQTLGYTVGEMLGRTFRDFEPPGAGAAPQDPSVFLPDYEASHLSKDGRTVHLHFAAVAIHDGDGRFVGSQGTAHDITARKLVEAYKEAGWEVLRILNESGSIRDSMRRVLVALKSKTSSDAVGIRLQQGDDFPYIVHEGFAESFLVRENSLRRREGIGAACAANERNLGLECTCGLVLSGTESPFLTPHGSFWTNDSFALLALSRDEDPRHNPRNQCIHYGYGSVALVPIRAREKLVGLLQFNHLRRGAFSIEGIEILEGVAAHIGEALVRTLADSALSEGAERLREHQQRLQAMAFEAAVGAERERRRLATVLHDGIGQNLALMQLKLSAARTPLTGAPREAIDEALVLLGQTIQDSRSLTFELSPPILYDLGISPALSWLSDELSKHPGMQIALTDDDAPKPLDETTAAMLFRAVRELLLNVYKHAKSLVAEVSLRCVGDTLEVVVADSGAGFDPKAVAPGAAAGGFGLMSVREQIGRLGGTVEISSAKGEGTRARVTVPLAPNRRGTDG